MVLHPQNAPHISIASKINASDKDQPDRVGDIFARTLLAFEGSVRDIREEKSLIAHLCNETRNIFQFRQAFFLQRKTKNSPLICNAVSSVAAVDRDAPYIRWIEKLVRRLGEERSIEKQHFFTLPAYCDDTDDEVHNYPFREFLWTPLNDGGEVFAGFLTVRDTPWSDKDLSLATRLASLYAHSFLAIKGHHRLTRAPIFTKKRSMILAGGMFLLAFFPVHITALAPVEVIAEEPFVIAAPFDAVVKDILVQQGSKVQKGQEIIAFDDVELRNNYYIADEKEAVAEAKYLRASQGAIADPREKREVAIAKSEYELAKAEKSYAKELLDNSILKADSDGIAIYTDKRDWLGKPVSAGEAIIQIADPDQIIFSIDLPVKESLVLKEGTGIKVFLNSEPLKPIQATLTEASYEPRTDKRNILSYRITARLTDKTRQPRIGIQGTAQVKGSRAPIGYVLIRRPLMALRQMTGW